MYGNDLYHHFAVNYFNRLKSSSTLLCSSFAPHSMWYCLILLHRSLACGITISLSLALLSRACVYNREHQKTHKICTTEALLLRVAALLLLPLRFAPVPEKRWLEKLLPLVNRKWNFWSLTTTISFPASVTLYHREKFDSSFDKFKLHCRSGGGRGGFVKTLAVATRP